MKHHSPPNHPQSFYLCSYDVSYGCILRCARARMWTQDNLGFGHPMLAQVRKRLRPLTQWPYLDPVDAPKPSFEQSVGAIAEILERAQGLSPTCHPNNTRTSMYQGN